MSINGVNLFGFCNGRLSEETKRKLKALGIDPSTVVSEAQAYQLIANALKNQSVTQAQEVQSKTASASETEIQTRDLIYTMLDMNANLNKYLHKL